MNLIQRYGIEPGQIYVRADGAEGALEVLDTTTFASVDDVVVRDLLRDYTYRIDAFKLAMVRYDFAGYSVDKDVN